MMKFKISSPYRKMKLLLILPVIAVVLYSFAKPEYKYISDYESNSTASLSSQVSKEVKGTIVNPSGLPLTGAAIVLRGTTSGATSDSRGFFQLKDVPEEGVLIVSYVGFKTKVIKPVFTADMSIKMERDTVTLRSIGVPPPPPPPPPAPEVRIRNTDGSEARPLFVIDGINKGKEGLKGINPEEIGSMTVLKDEAAIAKYGVEGRDGVIEITLKPGVNSEDLSGKSDSKIESIKVTGYGAQEKEPVSDKDAFFVVEEMPAFPGGEKALQSYLYSNINVVKGSEKISEPVLVVFTVDSKGKVRDPKVLKKKYPVWEDEAIRVVSGMPDWKPGKQHGIPVDVMVQLPIDFSTINK